MTQARIKQLREQGLPVKNIYDISNRHCAEHLKGKLVVVSDDVNLKSQNLYIEKLLSISDINVPPFSDAGSEYWRYLIELDFNTEPKVYHAANRDEARHLIGKEVEAFGDDGKWIKGVLTRINSLAASTRSLCVFYCEGEMYNGGCSNFTLIRELPTPSATDMTLEQIEAKLGHKVRLVA